MTINSIGAVQGLPKNCLFHGLTFDDFRGIVFTATKRKNRIQNHVQLYRSEVLFIKSPIFNPHKLFESRKNTQLIKLSSEFYAFNATFSPDFKRLLYLAKDS